MFGSSFWISMTDMAGALDMDSSITLCSGHIEMLMLMTHSWRGQQPVTACFIQQKGVLYLDLSTDWFA